LKCPILVVQLWLQGYSNFWISFLLPKRSLLMLRTRVLIYKPMQTLWTMLFCVLVWHMMEPFDGSCFGHALSKVC
jgi:hypothetical protein